jgi:hypothetical protein
MTLLLGLTNLVSAERAMLEHLHQMVEDDAYFDTVARMEANPFGKAILVNIMIKGRAAGLGPILEQLKEKHANVQPMEDGPRDPSSCLPAA